jgi:hypothetical protein
MVRRIINRPHRVDTPKPPAKMVEMAAKQTIVEEIVRSDYFKFSATASVTIETTRRDQLDHGKK